MPAVAPEPDGLQSRLVERVGMYQAAAASARQAGDGSRLRRYERGLKVSWGCGPPQPPFLPPFFPE